PMDAAARQHDLAHRHPTVNADSRVTSRVRDVVALLSRQQADSDTRAKAATRTGDWAGVNVNGGTPAAHILADVLFSMHANAIANASIPTITSGLILRRFCCTKVLVCRLWRKFSPS